MALVTLYIFQTVILFSFWAPCDSTTLPDLVVIVHDLVALVKLAGYFGLIGVQPLVIIFHVLGMLTLDFRFLSELLVGQHAFCTIVPNSCDILFETFLDNEIEIWDELSGSLRWIRRLVCWQESWVCIVAATFEQLFAPCCFACCLVMALARILFEGERGRDDM